jgi:hypothetical protein
MFGKAANLWWGRGVTAGNGTQPGGPGHARKDRHCGQATPFCRAVACRWPAGDRLKPPMVLLLAAWSLDACGLVKSAADARATMEHGCALDSGVCIVLPRPARGRSCRRAPLAFVSRFGWRGMGCALAWAFPRLHACCLCPLAQVGCPPPGRPPHDVEVRGNRRRARRADLSIRSKVAAPMPQSGARRRSAQAVPVPSTIPPVPKGGSGEVSHTAVQATAAGPRARQHPHALASPLDSPMGLGGSGGGSGAARARGSARRPSGNGAGRPWR